MLLNNVPSIKSSTEILGSEKIINAIISFLISSPLFIYLLFFSFISGYAWCFLITTYLKEKNKGNSFIKSISGNIVFGFLWFMLIHVPIYWIRFGLSMNIESILDNCAYDIIYGLFLQAIILISFLMFKKEK